jgi:serine/threonine-protein kinase
MKRNTPLITLLTGAALGVILLIASMLSTPKAPTRYAAAATPTPASTAATVPASVSPTPTPTAVANVPARADYAGDVHGGAASVAISIHGSQAIAYVCNGSVIEAWLKGTAVGGRLIMTGKNQARLSAVYDAKQATGNVVAHGIVYTFSVAAVHKPSGLYRSIAVVRGATIKAGWIVLPNGKQVGSLESNANAAAPSATQAPVLDVAAGTARDGSTVLAATPVSGVTGSGF